FLAATDPMRLKDAPLTPEQRKQHLRGSGLPWYTDPGRTREPNKPYTDYFAGRQVFAKGCIACHSSGQPGDPPDLEAELTDKDLPRPPGFPDTWDPAKLMPDEKSRLADARRGLRLTADDRAQLTRGTGVLPPGYSRWAQHAIHQRKFWEHP